MNQERKSMKDQSLVGMFVPLDGHDDYRTGCIVAAVGLGQRLLIQWDKMVDDESPPPPMECTRSASSVRALDCGHRVARFFKAREEMERWIAWVDEPADVHPLMTAIDGGMLGN
jgi:hypothetical protein